MKQGSPPPVPPNLESFMPLGGTRDNENGYDSSGGDVSCTSISRVGCKLDLLARDRCSSGTSVQPWLPLVALGRGGFARPRPFSLTRFSEQERGKQPKNAEASEAGYRPPVTPSLEERKKQPQNAEASEAGCRPLVTPSLEEREKQPQTSAAAEAGSQPAVPPSLEERGKRPTNGETAEQAAVLMKVSRSSVYAAETLDR